MKRESCLASLVVFYHMPSSVDEKKAADVIFLGFKKTFNNFSLTNLESMNEVVFERCLNCRAQMIVVLGVKANRCTPRVDTGSRTV